MSEKENSMANTAHISINCISPATSSEDEGASSEENDVVGDEDLRV